MTNSLLRRYTDMPALLHLLRTKKITLLDPKTWDDKNDSSFLESYKVKTKLTTILALCFTEKPETYHHWKVFAGGSSGICIRFRKDMLLKSFENKTGIIHGPVEYRTLNDMRKISPMVHELPFLKRYPFRDEGEYRIIYKGKNKKRIFINIQIDLSSISRIVLSPWLPKALTNSAKETIKSIPGCSDIGVFRTTLNENAEWKEIGDSAV